MDYTTVREDKARPFVSVPTLSIVLRLELSIHDLLKESESILPARIIQNRIVANDEFAAHPIPLFHLLHEGTRFKEEWRRFLLFPTRHDPGREGRLVFYRCDDTGSWKARSVGVSDDVHFGIESKHLRVKFIL